MLGSNNSEKKIFLSVAFGKLRQKHFDGKKVDKDTPGAICRETPQHAETWAVEHDFVTGIIKNIFYKQDPKYGDSFEVVISDVADTYQLSFPEKSRFWIDFAKKLPGIKLPEIVKINPYDFEDKGTGKKRAGVSIEQNSVKIVSQYDKKISDGKYELLFGFPSGEGVNFKDKDESDMYFIKVKKFMRSEFFRLFDKIFTGQKQESSEHIDETAPGADDSREKDMPDFDNLPF